MRFSTFMKLSAYSVPQSQKKVAIKKGNSSRDKQGYQRAPGQFALLTRSTNTIHLARQTGIVSFWPRNPRGISQVPGVTSPRGPKDSWGPQTSPPRPLLAPPPFLLDRLPDRETAVTSHNLANVCVLQLMCWCALPEIPWSMPNWKPMKMPDHESRAAILSWPDFPTSARNLSMLPTDGNWLPSLEFREGWISWLVCYFFISVPSGATKDRGVRPLYNVS